MDALILSVAMVSSLSRLGHVASVGATYRRVARQDRSHSPKRRWPAVTIVRPVCGIENFAEETLESSFTLDHPNYELIFCVANAADPIVPLVERLIAKYPERNARLLTGHDAISANPKLNNIAKGWRAARHDWIIMADSNVLLPPDYVERLLRQWSLDTGLVCSPPIGSRPEGFAAELECAFLNTHQARWQAFADTLGVGFAQGKTMCWRRDVLEAAGGIAMLGREIAEDAAATKIIRGSGLRVRLVDRMFEQPLGRRALGDVWRRQLRWARLRRATFKHFYMPELLSGGLFPILATIASAASLELSAAGAAIASIGLWYGAEAVLAWRAGWHLSWRAPVTWLLRDLLLPALWIASWLGSEFVWRGNPMQIAAQEVR
jgi:ceramide glucosyltransferase